MIELRLGKGNGMGRKKAKSSKESGFKRIKWASKKGLKRKKALKVTKDMVLNAMHERWGFTFCMGSIHPLYRHIDCGGQLDLAHVIPASRHSENRDGCHNLGILCRRHHSYFTTTPGLYDVEFRTREMKKWMNELDKQ